jgi:ribonuclease Z
MLEVIFLGTGGAVPTPGRNTSSVMLRYEGEKILFDCGEGTQRQMMIAKTGMKNLKRIFISHFHADHFIGLPGLIQTMNFNGRIEDLFIYGPLYAERFVELIKSMGYCKFRFNIIGKELKEGDFIDGDNYRITAFKTDHNVPSLGYIFQENDRQGRFNVEKATSLGLKPGPSFAKLCSGLHVELDGKTITPEMVIGPKRSGRKIVYSGDTRPCESLLNASKGADLLIADGTLESNLKDWAIDTKHSTVRESAELARSAGVKRLILTHISPRYSDNIKKLKDEIKEFDSAMIAEDFLKIEIPFRD